MNTAVSGKDKSTVYNCLKVLLTFLVVFAHASRMYTGKGVITPVLSSNTLTLITNFIYSFHMKLYMAVSGMVYGLCVIEYKKYQDSFKFIINKAKRLMIPYLFWGIVLVAPVMVACHFTDRTYLSYVFDGIILANDNRHLWYIIVLFYIFCVFAVIRKWIERINPIIILVICLLVSYYQNKIVLPLSLNSFANYILYFYLGYVFNLYFDKIVKIVSNPLAILICFLIDAYLFTKPGWVFSIMTGVFGSCFFIGITYHLSKIISGIKFFDLLNQNGYGIYLFHPMIIYVLFYYLANKNIYPWILCSLISVFAYFLSFFLSILIRKLRMHILLGE